MGAAVKEAVAVYDNRYQLVSGVHGVLLCKLFNARSLCILLSFDIIFITESWLNSDLPNSLLLSSSLYYRLRKDIGLMDMVGL